MDSGKKITIKKDKGFVRSCGFSWINFELYNRRIEKARICVADRRLIINSITIFPEFERHGYARNVINFFKEKFEVIIADRVRNTAHGFWKKMGFVSTSNGNYIWKTSQKLAHACVPIGDLKEVVIIQNDYLLD